MLISHINPRPSSMKMKRGDGSIEMTNKRKNCKRREMVMSIMIYDEMTDKVGWNRENNKTTTTSNGDGKLPEGGGNRVIV